MQAEQQSERERFEADAGPYGFDLTRCELSLSGEPWTEYRDSGTGHRWAGWLAARNPHQVPAALSSQSTPQPLESYALQLLVAAGHITQQKADEAMHLARATLFPPPPEQGGPNA